jgi:hypothetical protein
VSPFERLLTDEELRRYSITFSRRHARAFILPTTRALELLRLPVGLRRKLYEADARLLRQSPGLARHETGQVLEGVINFRS